MRQEYMSDSFEFFDGETINNKYVLLSNSKEHIYNAKGLRLKECLDFVFQKSISNNSYFFVIDYDVNMFFSGVKDYNENKKKILKFFDGEEVKFYNYELLYYRNKILKIKLKNKVKYFYDVSNFLNTTFMKTLELFKVKISDKDSNFLAKYKNLRDKFTKKDLDNIIKYNSLECRLGKELVKKIYELLPGELKKKSLYGSSSLAEKFLLNKQADKINAFTREQLNNKLFESAYFGGRMEVFKVGKFSECYKYDINSAYPSIIKDLRRVEKITKRKFDSKKNKITDTNLYFINLEINNPLMIGLLPVRLKSGYIVFPNRVNGWFYGKELKEVVKYDFISYEITKEIDIELGDKIFNKNEIENYYALRLELKNKNDSRHLIYKILLNSIYGKFSQQVGSKKFLSFYYAGLITSFTRAKILDAIRENYKDIIFIATDGILSLKRLNLKVSKELGGWSFESYKSAYVIQSGVYELTNDKGEKTYAERGFKSNFDELLESIRKSGKYIIKADVFVGNKYYSKNYKAFKEKRCKFTKIERIIDINNQFKRKFLNIKLNKQNDSYLLNSLDLKGLNEKSAENFELIETFNNYLKD